MIFRHIEEHIRYYLERQAFVLMLNLSRAGNASPDWIRERVTTFHKHVQIPQNVIEIGISGQSIELNYACIQFWLERKEMDPQWIVDHCKRVLDRTKNVGLSPLFLHAEYKGMNSLMCVARAMTLFPEFPWNGLLAVNSVFEQEIIFADEAFKLLRQAPYICHILQANSKRYANLAYISMKLLSDAGEKTLNRFQEVGSGYGVVLISQNTWDRMIGQYYQLKEGGGNLALKAMETAGTHPLMDVRMKSIVNQVGNEGALDDDDEGLEGGIDGGDDNNDPRPPRPPGAAPQPRPRPNPDNGENNAQPPRNPQPGRNPPQYPNPRNDDDGNDGNDGDQGGERMVVEEEQREDPREQEEQQEEPGVQQVDEVTPPRRSVAFREPPGRTPSISSDYVGSPIPGSSSDYHMSPVLASHSGLIPISASKKRPA